MDRLGKVDLKEISSFLCFLVSSREKKIIELTVLDFYSKVSFSTGKKNPLNPLRVGSVLLGHHSSAQHFEGTSWVIKYNLLKSQGASFMQDFQTT